MIALNLAILNKLSEKVYNVFTLFRNLNYCKGHSKPWLPHTVGGSKSSF